ncbi:hypothetical protein [Gemmatimonas groenlandica]|uniref:Uncharacterized protein n=1 Tax=Gemmatimonas groenlandica TaxID=2732249 RepID=A0A6M4IQH6_9BACT|nr:hypothetical protein [Gemmatimonas groenlandica]QJR35092.1 hypothetical protein HKW67_06010 [Gemmatimonas groenlandica]
MSTSDSSPSNSADLRSMHAPYAFPQTASASGSHTSNVARVKVGPYVPAPWRGKPALSGTPLSVTPLSVTPLSVTPLSVVAMPVSEMPPSYPTPAYFTPLGSRSQDDFVTPAFDLPAIVDETEGLAAVSFAEPVESSLPETSSLPWIDAFLSSTPAMPMRVVDEPVASFTPPSSETIVDEAVAAIEWPMTAPAPEAPTPSDAWALDEAAEQMRAIADELRDHEGIAGGLGEAARLFDASPSPDPLPAWSDDDMIDIMPVQQERAATPNRAPTPASNSALEPWADRARRAGDESAEAAARALELLARRVRDGEISLAGYEPRLGDAAALAAALAALLGVRR